MCVVQIRGSVWLIRSNRLEEIKRAMGEVVSDWLVSGKRRALLRLQMVSLDHLTEVEKGVCRINLLLVLTSRGVHYSTIHLEDIQSIEDYLLCTDWLIRDLSCIWCMKLVELKVIHLKAVQMLHKHFAQHARPKSA